MTEVPLRIGIITGSTRANRFGPTVTDWFHSQAKHRTDMVLDLIDLADLDLPATYPARLGPAETSYAARIDDADGYVVVTPEYNHGYPASLKQAVDLAKRQWHAKPVAFVSYGGLAGGLRAVEQLRQVFAELHAVTLRDTVSFHNHARLFDRFGELIEPAEANEAARVLLERLAWWARALRTARATDPYAP